MSKLLIFQHTGPATDAIIKEEGVEEGNTNDKVPQIDLPCENSETPGNQLTEPLITLQEVNNNCFLQVPVETLQEDSVPILDEAPTSTIQKPVDEDSQSDKTSNLSSNSQKTISDGSMLTNCSADDNKSKSKSANPNRKNTNPLIRSHTAKTVISTPSNQPIIPKQLKQPVTEREREQGGDYLIEICGRYLNVYGAGAIKFIDRQWNIQKANDVHTFKFSYVNFNSIATVLNRIKVRFPNVENFVFRETNITNLGQLNALAEIQGISSLVIDPEGNLICTKKWRLYAIYRLSHWGIKTINGEEVTPEEIEEAQAAYTGLSDLVLWSLPDSLLEPLLARLRLDENFSASKLTPKQWLMDADQSLKAVVGKEALQCKKLMAAPDESVIRLKGRNYFATMMENTCNAVEKLQKLEALWPNMLVEMVTNTLLDYAQVDVYVKNLMTELMKGPPEVGPKFH